MSDIQTGRCWCGNDDTTGGHEHSPGVYEVAELQNRTNCGLGMHSWLPWLRISPDSSLPSASWVTRCIHCGRTEQWDA